MADRLHVSLQQAAPPEIYPPRKLAEADLAAMKRFLDEISPTTTAVALSRLREMFPETPLAERVRAVAALRH